MRAQSSTGRKPIRARKFGTSWQEPWAGRSWMISWRVGRNFDLNGASFHGHWRLCKFLLEQGADANRPLDDTGETPLHAALCDASNRVLHDRVLMVLLSYGANPNAATNPNVETGGFMR